MHHTALQCYNSSVGRYDEGVCMAHKIASQPPDNGEAILVR